MIHFRIHNFYDVNFRWYWLYVDIVVFDTNDRVP